MLLQQLRLQGILLPVRPSPQLQNPNFTPAQKCRSPRTSSSSSIACTSITQNSQSEAVDHERTPVVNWRALFRMIYTMKKPELGAGSVLSRCVSSGRQPTERDLWRIIVELRRVGRHTKALEVYDWMDSRRDLYTPTANDATEFLNIIVEVRGVSAAQRFFKDIPSASKDGKTHQALLNALAQARMVEETEKLFASMRGEGYLEHALPFNVMMNLYIKMKQYDKIERVVSEMIEKNIEFDINSYNLWLSSFGSQGLADEMEQVFEQMKLDSRVNLNWTTFNIMANMYINIGETEKAEDCLRNLESRITGRDRIPYHYLLTQYGRCGNKEQVYRVWNTYKAGFDIIPNQGFHAVISSLLQLNDIQGAEKMYDDWQRVGSSYDPRIGNLLLGFYVRAGSVDKARNLFEHMTEVGGRPNSNSWELLGELFIKERRTTEALSCLKEALGLAKSKSWQPKAYTISSFVTLCEEEGDMESKEVFLGLYKRAGYLKDKRMDHRTAHPPLTVGKNPVIDVDTSGGV